MLRVLRQGQRWVLWFVIVVVGGVFVLYLGFGGSFGPADGSEVVVDVDGRTFTARDVLRERENQEESYRRTLGGDFDPEAVADYLDEAAARSLLQRALLAGEAERLGLHVTDREVRGYLRALPGAADERGRLDRDVITGFAERNYGSLRRFQEALRDDLLAIKARRLLSESVAVSTSEARDALRYRREEAEIAYVALSPDPDPEAEVPGARVAALLAEEPERVTAAYEARRDEFQQPEQVRARHVLIRVSQDAPEEAIAAARVRAEAARTRIVEGSDFADVALELSEDPGSKARGGDLGLFARGTMALPFEQVAFSLEPGVVSEPVQSSFGWHVIRVEEKRAAQTRSLDDVREELARELVRKDLAGEVARSRAEALLEAIRGGQSLTDAAREAELTLERPDPVRRRPDGRIPGLGPAPEVMTAAFALEGDAPTAQKVFRVGDKWVLVQRLALHTPPETEITAVLEEARTAMLSRRRSDALDRWFRERQQVLADEGRLVLNLAALRP